MWAVCFCIRVNVKLNLVLVLNANAHMAGESWRRDACRRVNSPRRGGERGDPVGQASQALSSEGPLVSLNWSHALQVLEESHCCKFGLGTKYLYVCSEQ